MVFSTSCSNSEQKLARELEKASQYEQEGKLQDSITLLESLNDRNPGRAEILEPLAFAYSKSKQYDFAAFTFAEIAEMDRSNDMFYLQAAEHALLAGDEDSAIRYYKSFLLHNRQDSSSWEQLGKLQQGRNFYQDAAESFMEKHKLDPSGDTALKIAQSFLALGNLTQADRWFQSARGFGAEFEKDALIGLVETAYAKNQTTNLESYLEELKNKYPAALETENIRNLSAQLAEFQAERNALNQMLQNSVTATEAEGTAEAAAAEPETSKVTPAETETMVAANEATTATGEGEALALPAEEETNVTTVAQVNTAKEDLPQDMLEEVERTLQPEQATATTTAEVAANAEQTATISPAQMLEESFVEDHIHEAVEVLPENAGMLERARFEFQSGNYQRASDLYWNYLSTDDSNPQVWRELSNAFLRQQQYRPARAAALEALRRDPQNLVYVFQHLRVLQRTESPERFLQELQNTRRRFPRSPDVSLALARTYGQVFNDLGNSRFYYQEFLRFSDLDHPSRNEANEALGLPLEEPPVADSIEGF